MMWNSPILKPVEGDLKVVTKFAWLPKRIGDKKIWLERYQQLYEYVRRPRAIWFAHSSLPTVTIECSDWDLIGEKHMRGVPNMDNPPPPPGSSEREIREWKKIVKDKKIESFNK